MKKRDRWFWIAVVILSCPLAATAGEPALAEAEAALSAKRPRLTLLEPPGRVLTGAVFVPVRVEQAPDLPPEERIDRVRFSLDGKPLLTRNRPPFDVTLDLGRVPRPRKLGAEGLSGNGQVVARDELSINAAAQGFRVRLLEPRPGRAYRQSVGILAEVMPPAGSAVERVELWFGEERVAVLDRPPYSKPFLLPRQGEAGYVRAVAFLAGGGSSEDVVFINTPQEPDRIDVRLVELYTTVLDGRGRPVTGGLDPGSFKVIEDGVIQDIRQVEQVGEAPVRVVTLIDGSSSMIEEMDATRRAALGFLRSLLRPQDQAAVIAFNSTPQIMVPLTGNLRELEAGIWKILAERDTALWDSLAYSLLYLSPARGQRAVLLLTDGEDRVSQLSFEQLLETAQRMGIAVYVIGLGLADGRWGQGAKQLNQLARETGGRTFFIKDTSKLAGIYAEIEADLRAQYKISYQSTNNAPGDAFRSVQVRMAKSGMEARTISGYYP